MSNSQRPTPETDAEVKRIQADQSIFVCEEFNVLSDFTRNLERQRDEARQQLEAMREAIKEAHEALEISSRSLHGSSYYKAQSALAKLQPFLKL